MVANTQDLAIRPKEASLLVDQKAGGVVEYGKELREQQFLFDPAFRNFNHGESHTSPNLDP